MNEFTPAREFFQDSQHKKIKIGRLNLVMSLFVFIYFIAMRLKHGFEQ